MNKREIKPARKRAALLGVGLDAEDGHKRLTQAETFAVVGGSEETHDRMTETLIKTMEDLKRTDKSLETVNRDELIELLQKHSDQS